MRRSASAPIDTNRISQSIAVVVASRSHGSLNLIQQLVQHHFTSTERGPEDALSFVQHLRPGLVIAVIDPSRAPDLDLLRAVARGSDAIVMVIARDNDALAASLRAGADIYLRESDGPEAVAAQIAAIRRRMTATVAKAGPEVIERGELRIEPRTGQATFAGIPLGLTRSEFALLVALASEDGKVVEPLDAAWRISGKIVDETEASQTIKVYVRRIRQKLEKAGADPSLVINVRGYGYLLDAAAATHRTAIA